MDPEGNLTQQISFTGYRVVDTKVLTTPGNMLGSQRISPILQKSFSLHISLGPLERLLGLVLRCVTTSEGAVTLSFGPPLKGKDPYCQRSETLHGSYNCTSPCASPKVQWGQGVWVPAKRMWEEMCLTSEPGPKKPLLWIFTGFPREERDSGDLEKVGSARWEKPGSLNWGKEQKWGHLALDVNKR